MEVQHRTKKYNSWPAWSSELDDLRKLGARVEKLANDRIEDFVAEYERNATDKRSDSDKERTKRYIRNGLRVSAEFLDGDDEVQGPIPDVLNELDRRTTRQLSFKVDASHVPTMNGERIVLSFSRKKEGNSVELEVQSSDPGWARQALTILSEEVEKGVPKWARARTRAGQFLVALAVAVPTVIIAALLFPSHWPAWQRVLVGLIPATVVACITVMPEIISWLFPSFEITSDSGGSTGGRRIAAALALVASVPLGIVVNLIT